MLSSRQHSGGAQAKPVSTSSTRSPGMCSNTPSSTMLVTSDSTG